MKAEFDSTYPIRLNGIISQDEFRESIHRINHSLSSRKISTPCIVIFIMIIIAGIGSMVGGFTSIFSDTPTFAPLIGVGIILTIFGATVMLFGCATVSLRYIACIRQVIAEESMKYSSRSPTPCSWRLESMTQCANSFGNRQNAQIVFHHVSIIHL
jgi:hypothetical protein